MSTYVPTDVQTIETTISGTRSSVSLSASSFFSIRLNCTSLITAAYPVMRTYDYGDIARTVNIIPDSSAEYVQEMLQTLLDSCFVSTNTNANNGRNENINSNTTTDITTNINRNRSRNINTNRNTNRNISVTNTPSDIKRTRSYVTVVRTDVRAQKGVATQNTFRWKISFFSPLLTAYNFPLLSVKSNLTVLGPDSELAVCGVTVTRVGAEYFLGTFRINIGGFWTIPLHYGNDSITVIEALEELTTVNAVTVTIERRDSTDNNYRKISNVIYEICFLNSENWSPDGFDISVNGFLNNGNLNENNGKQSVAEELWRPAFGATFPILVEHLPDLDNEIFVNVSVIQNGFVHSDKINIILTDLGLSPSQNEVKNENILFSSLDIFVLPTRDAPQVRTYVRTHVRTCIRTEL